MNGSRYLVTLGDASDPKVVDLGFDAARGAWQASVDGTEIQLQLDAVVGEVVRAWVDGELVELCLKPGAAGGSLGFRGERPTAVRVRTLGEVALTAAQPSPQPAPTDATVVSPITGVVLTVDAEPSRATEAGGGLLVIEAMKMEMVVPSPLSGYIVAVHVKPGDQVRAGADLVTLRARRHNGEVTS